MRSVEGAPKAGAFEVGEHAGFHLIHHISAADSADRIGEGDAATGAGVSEGACGGPEGAALFKAVRRDRITHETDGESGLQLEDGIGALDAWAVDFAEGFFCEEAF